MTYSNINNNLYRVFIVVFENKCISKAAEELNLTQPSVTYNIKEIERQLGTQLFIAHRRGVEPTPEAISLYESIKPAYDMLNTAARDIDFNAHNSGTIRIGCPAHFASTVLLDFICNFNKKYPEIKLDITYKPKKDVIELLAKNRIDIMINTEPTLDDNKLFEKIKVKELQHTFFASSEFLRNHGLTKHITPKQLKSTPLILYGSQLSITKNLCAVLPEITAKYVAPITESMYQMAFNNIGIGYCIKDFFTGIYANNTIIQLEIDVELPTASLVCLRNRDNHSKVVSTFFDALRAYSDGWRG